MAYSSPHLTRTSQVSIAVENTIGTEVDFGDSGTAAAVWIDSTDHEHRSTPERFDRPIYNGTLTMRPRAIGARAGDVIARGPISGSPLALTGAPFYARALRGMGFKRTLIKSLLVESFSPAPFAEGSLITDTASQGSATKSGRVVTVENLGSGQRRVYYIPLTGVFAGTDTLYDDAGTQNSAAVTDAAAPVDAGYRYTPVTERSGQTPETVTVERRIAGRRHTVAGARGRGSITLNGGEPVMVRGEFRGPYILTEAGAPRPGTLIAPASLPAPVIPPVIRGAQLTVTPAGGSAHTPVLSQCEISIDNTVSDRRTIGGGEVGSTGHAAPAIGERTITVTIEPESQPASFDAELLAYAGTTIALSARVGELTGTSGLVIIKCPALQLDGDLAKGDRDGFATEALSLVATGNDDDEIVIDHVIRA